jgi:hypothetical protein
MVYRKRSELLTVKFGDKHTVQCLASDLWLRHLESEIMDMRYGNLFTPLSLPCSALTEA